MIFFFVLNSLKGVYELVLLSKAIKELCKPCRVEGVDIYLLIIIHCSIFLFNIPYYCLSDLYKNNTMLKFNIMVGIPLNVICIASVILVTRDYYDLV